MEFLWSLNVGAWSFSLAAARRFLKSIGILSAEPTSPEISFVIPCHNEQDNLRALVKTIREVADPLKRAYEIVIADDFSTDNSWAVLKELITA